MNSRLNWIASIAADARASHIVARTAVAIAGMADDRGRLCASMTALAASCQISARHMVFHLGRLVEFGYIKSNAMSRQGRFDVEIIVEPDEQVPAVGKPFREVAGSVVGVVEQPGQGSYCVYVEAPAEMTKVTLGRRDFETITAALTLPASGPDPDQGPPRSKRALDLAAGRLWRGSISAP